MKIWVPFPLCLEPVPWSGVSTPEFLPHRLVPGSVGGPLPERRNSYHPVSSSSSSPPRRASFLGASVTSYLSLFLLGAFHRITRPRARCTRVSTDPQRRRRGERVPWEEVARYQGCTRPPVEAKQQGNRGLRVESQGAGEAEARGCGSWNWAELEPGAGWTRPTPPPLRRRTLSAQRAGGAPGVRLRCGVWGAPSAEQGGVGMGVRGEIPTSNLMASWQRVLRSGRWCGSGLSCLYVGWGWG